MKKVFNLIIVDESGSMSIIEKQALAGMNETLDTVKKMQQLHPDMEQSVTLVTFDSSHTHFHFDNTAAVDIRPLRPDEYNPGGATPLYDAIGRAVYKLFAQTGADDNVLVTIITDGEENSSVEFTLKMVKQLIEKLKHQGWTFTLIGTDNLDVEGMAESMAISAHMAFTQDEKGTNDMFACERRARVRYYDRIESGAVEDADDFFGK